MTVGEHLASLFVKKCSNEFNTYDYQDSFGNKRRQWYRRGDLDQLSREAFEKGQEHFYAVQEPGGMTAKFVAAEPEYEYVLKRSLTPVEYDAIKSILCQELTEEKEVPEQ